MRQWTNIGINAAEYEHAAVHYRLSQISIKSCYPIRGAEVQRGALQRDSAVTG